MKRLIGIVLALLLVAPASAQSPQIRQLLLRQMPAATAGAAFSGIADVYTNTLVHIGNRAASAARKGNKLWNVCDATGANCVDWSSDATTGLIVPTLINGSSCGVVTCVIKIAYDDSGLTNCNVGASPCDVTNATNANRPTVLLAGPNGIPVMVCSGTQFLSSATNITSTSQPYTMSMVAKRTGSTASFTTGFGIGALLSFENSTGVMGGYAGAKLDTASGLTEGNFHALQFMGNTTSSVKGDSQTPVTGSAGAGAMGATPVVVCSDNFAETMTGQFAEGWAGSGDQSATFSSAFTNQQSAYGL